MKFEILHRGEVIETKELPEGSFKVGRSSTCDIQLKSPQVSKQHALIVIKGNKAAVVDAGSSNGIFVNGILVRKQRIENGDEVVIADFKIRIAANAKPKEAARPSITPGYADDNLARNMNYQPVNMGGESQPEQVPAMSAGEKAVLILDEKVLAPFYGLMKAVDWRMLLLSIQGIALLAAVLLSVIPIVRWGKRIVTDEALSRAHTVLAQAVRENYRILSKSDDYTRLTVEACEAEQGILSCLVIDPKSNTVIAPTKMLNKPITDFYTLAALKRVTDKREEIVSEERDMGNYIVAEPLYLSSPAESEKILKGVIVAEFEVPAKVYSTFEPLVEAGLFAVLCSLLAYFFIFKMFTYPLVSMQEQLDAALKGDKVTITSAAKSPELESLATVINFSVSRMNQAGGGMAQAVSSSDSSQEDSDYERSVQEFDQGTSDGLLLLNPDKKVVFVGKILEDLIGMRGQYAKGQNVSDACRDQSFAGTAIDLAERVISSLGESQGSQLDINGTARNINAVAHKSGTGEIRFVLITIKMNGG